MSIKDFTNELNGTRVEGELIKTILYSLITSGIVFGVVYFLRLRSIEDFILKRGFYIILAIISYSLIVATVRQVRAYREFACMSGMMIGMIAGMLAGFLSGFFVAATNGMFVGAVFGMAIGIILGTWLGSCCGIMGFLEGIMAGFMGGLMGAMTAFMLLNDHLQIATIIIFIISAVILGGLNYMIYKEMKENERQRKEDHFWTIVLSFVLTVLTIWLIAFGPRSGAFGLS